MRELGLLPAGPEAAGAPHPVVAQLETIAVPRCLRIAGALREHSLWRDLCQRLSQDRAEELMEWERGSRDPHVWVWDTGNQRHCTPSLSPAFLSPRGEGLRLTKWQAGKDSDCGQHSRRPPMHQPLTPVEGGSCWILCQAMPGPTGWQRGFGLRLTLWFPMTPSTWHPRVLTYIESP